VTDELIFTTNENSDFRFSMRMIDGRLVAVMVAERVDAAICLGDEQTKAFIKTMAALQTPVDKAETPSDGIPPHEPSSCGTAYLAAERALRIIEHATKLGEAMSGDAIEQITNLAHEAGPAFNRAAMRRHAFADEIPF